VIDSNLSDSGKYADSIFSGRTEKFIKKTMLRKFSKDIKTFLPVSLYVY